MTIKIELPFVFSFFSETKDYEILVRKFGPPAPMYSTRIWGYSYDSSGSVTVSFEDEEDEVIARLTLP